MMNHETCLKTKMEVIEVEIEFEAINEYYFIRKIYIY